MTAELKELISKLSKVTPAEYGKMWKEYAKVYRQFEATRNFDEFIHSPNSIFDDLDGGVAFTKNGGQLKLSQ